MSVFFGTDEAVTTLVDEVDCEIANGGKGDEEDAGEAASTIFALETASRGARKGCGPVLATAPLGGTFDETLLIDTDTSEGFEADIGGGGTLDSLLPHGGDVTAGGGGGGVDDVEESVDWFDSADFDKEAGGDSLSTEAPLLLSIEGDGRDSAKGGGGVAELAEDVAPSADIGDGDNGFVGEDITTSPR